MRPATMVMAGTLLAGLLLAGRPASAAKLELRGWPGLEREAAALFEPALRAGADSVRLQQSLDAAVSRLQSDGWLDAHASASWSAGPDPGLSVEFAPGRRRRWASLELDVPPADSAAVTASLAWRPGRPAATTELADALARTLEDAEVSGHAWAAFDVSGWWVDSASVRVRISGVRGPRVTISDVRLEGLVATEPSVAERAMGRLRGLPYNRDAIRAASDRLLALGVFRRVEYLGLSGADDWQRGVLRWRVEEARVNSFEGAIGVQGASGPAGLADLELGNLLGTARAVSLRWQSRGRGLTDFAARYAEPLVLGTPLRLDAILQQQLQDTTYSRFTWGAHARVVVGTREALAAGFTEERVAQTVGEVQSADLQNTSFTLERDGRDRPPAPRRGTFARLTATEVLEHDRLRAAAGTGPARRDVRSSTLELTGEWHRPLGAGSGLALETSAAGRFGAARVLADYERYAVGGAASLRGHDEAEYHADRYALARLEWRAFLGSAGERLALFWDHAEMASRRAAGNGRTPFARTAADGVGVGLRLQAAGGMVDLDYGLQPGRPFLEGKIHLRLVTAF